MRNDHRSARQELMIVGPLNSRRVAEFAETARRLGVPRVWVVSYLELIRGTCGAPRPGTLIRFESPGGCAETTRELLKAGISEMEARRRVPLSVAEIDRLTYERGEMLHPHQWFLGFRKVLRDLNTLWSDLGCRWMSTSEAIITAFDKAACLNRWADAGLPIPKQYPELSTYAQIRRAIPERHARVFVKLRYGYSAMGAVALEWRGDRVRAITTMQTGWANGRHRLYTTKRPCQVQREFEVSWLIDLLGVEQIVVADWLPKDRWQGIPYDLRVVTIGGEVRHVVGRANASPFTNLNLDARRMPRNVVEQRLGARWSAFESLCERAASTLPGAGMLGLDVLVGPRCRAFTLLEANAFGDFLPGLMHLGQTTYEAQLQAEQVCGTGIGA